MNKIDNNTILDKYKEISKLNIEEVYTKYNTSNSGLSNSEVNKRIKEYGKNIVIKEKNRSILYFIINAFKDEFLPFNNIYSQSKIRWSNISSKTPIKSCNKPIF